MNPFGRPKKPEEEKIRSRTITVRMPLELYEQLNQFCDKTNSFPSAVCRALLEDFFRENREEGEMLQ